MKRIVTFTIVILISSCAEKLIQRPENLIPPEKMTEILNDLAILNAAKMTSIAKFEVSGIESMDFIYKIHGIDSAQFVASDRYYASRPIEYESIYSRAEAKLESERRRLEEMKRLNDSLKQLEKDSMINRKYGQGNIKNDRPKNAPR